MPSVRMATVPDVKFSLWCDNSQSWDDLLAEATHAEQNGWDGLWVSDHFLPLGPGLDNLLENVGSNSLPSCGGKAKWMRTA